MNPAGLWNSATAGKLYLYRTRKKILAASKSICWICSSGCKSLVSSFPIICFGKDVYTERIDPARFRNITVKQRPEPITLTDWIRLFRELRADVVVFCYGWIGSFSWPAALGALLAGVRKRFAIQHLVPPPLPPPVEGSSPRAWLRRRIGERARRLFGWRVAAHLYHRTICVSNAVRDPLIKKYRFPQQKTVTIHNGVSLSALCRRKAQGFRFVNALVWAPRIFYLSVWQGLARPRESTFSSRRFLKSSVREYRWSVWCWVMDRSRKSCSQRHTPWD